MKLILTAEVYHLGSAGDTVEVKDGYGRNYLIPRGFAIQWTRGAEKQIDSIRKARVALHLTQEQVAELTSDRPYRLSRSAIGAIERGDHQPGLTALIGLTCPVSTRCSRILLATSQKLTRLSLPPVSSFSSPGKKTAVVTIP